MNDDMRLPVGILQAGNPRYPPVAWAPHDLEWAVHPEWQKNIEWYTRHELTRPSDKQRAVGGLAQKYQAALQMEYVGRSSLAAHSGY